MCSSDGGVNVLYHETNLEHFVLFRHNEDKQEGYVKENN